MIKPKKIPENFSKENIEEEKNCRLKLNRNENIYGTFNYIESAIKNMDFEEIHKFPNYEKFLEKLSKHLDINKENIILSNNSDEALDIIIKTYLNANDEIISCHDLNSKTIANILLMGFKINNTDFEKLEEMICENTKIIYCSTPNIDTGILIRFSTIETVLKKYPNILFVVDCSYVNYSNNATIQDFVDLAKNYDNIIIIKSFSYDYALAGLGLCYVYSNKNIIDNLKKIAPLDNVNCVALNCGYASLVNYQSFEEIKTGNSQVRELFFQALSDKGFMPYKSESNFVLCDFFNYSDFYYRKLRNNGVLTKKYEKSSKYSVSLRMTVPTVGGVKYISNLLNKQDLLIFSDDVIFNSNESYNVAINETFRHFAGYEISQNEIINIKNHSGYGCNWNKVKYLLEKHGFSVSLENIAQVFQKIFYNHNLKDKGKLNISKETFEELSEKYDLVILSEKLGDEINYLLKKFDIDKYFSYLVALDNLDINHIKPDVESLNIILRHCPYKTVKYIGDSVDDIIAGNKANIETIGTLSFGVDASSMINNYKHLCANYILEDANDIINFLKNEQI